ALARAGMPLHLLQGQLGHKNIAMTMRYAKFHPDYADVAAYFDRVAVTLGLTPASNTSGNTHTALAAATVAP
ncbi:MAG: tyrosine-type recombinase/integrase, partial [Gemmatimonadales bacterium]|nr:tyrosine-type recombinase/integrase [Gemmatimonadales bacterium]